MTWGKQIVAVAIALSFAFAAHPLSGQDDTAARLAEAQRKLAERQATAKKVAEAVASRPATGPSVPVPAAVSKSSSKIIYLVDNSWSSWGVSDPEDLNEVVRAISSLAPGQVFNILMIRDGTVTPFVANYAAPSDANRRKAYQFLRENGPAGEPALADGFQWASRLEPDAVWLVSQGKTKTPKSVAVDVKKAVAGRFRVNTSTRFVPPDENEERALTFLWLLAKENGGICVDALGHPLDKPATPAPKPANGESILAAPKGPTSLRE